MRGFLFLICGLLLVSPVLKAQQTVTGRITDAANEKALSQATIFVAGTTIGTASDEAGNYTIVIPGKGSYEIVFYHSGYQPEIFKILKPLPFHQLDVELLVGIPPEKVLIPHSQKDVDINWYGQQDVDFFWYKLLGTMPSKEGLEILNPEKVNFYLNSDDVLTVWCEEFVEIVNHEMGYHIWFALKGFQHDYTNNQTSYYGKPFFKELIPKNNRQKRLWEKKRAEVYAFSFTCFIRALYRKQIHEEGFLLAEKDSMQYRKILIPELKDILTENQEDEGITVNIVSPLYLACFSKPVTANTIQNSYSLIINRLMTFPLLILLPQQLTIYPDGTYSGLLKIQEQRKTITGLASMLPVEYERK